MSKPRKYHLTQVAANEVHLTTFEGKYFISYGTTIFFIDNEGKITLDLKHWSNSRTTSKYRNEFLGEGIAETRLKINSGEYKLANLNGVGA
jgi:hypothetical protein